jgi:predicted deacylase
MTVGKLKLLEFAGESTGPHLLITGGVHGDEFEPIAAIRKLSQMLAEESDQSRLLNGRVSLVPCVNEEAFLLGRRCATDGLDLARTCPGRSDGSITEQTAWALSELIRGADFYIDLHTGGTEFSIYPLAGYMLHPNNKVLDAQRRMAQAFGLPAIWGTAPNLDGRSLSVARDANVPAIYCEYHGAAVCSQTGVDAYVAGCLNVMAELKMIGRRPAIEAARYLVEDSRESSGHLQVCNPSPVDGFFEPCVELGQTVGAGAVLGTVIATQDDSLHAIVSSHPGLVLMLRTFPRVRACESVGVILESV